MRSLYLSRSSDTRSLTSSGIWLMEYKQKRAAERVQSDQVIGADGGEVSEVTYDDVTESLRVLVEAADIDAAQVIKEEIERYFEWARARQARRAGPRVYAVYQPDPDGIAHRTELLHGRVEFGSGPLGVAWIDGMVELLIVWKRRFFWEELTALALPLSNSNGSSNTSGLTVYDHDDADSGHDNYVEIAAANVHGTLPAPLDLTLTNSAAPVVNVIYAALNARSAPASLSHVLEAESATTAYGSNASSGNSSAGSHKSLSWTATTEIGLLTWSLSSALLVAVGGQYVRLMLRALTTAANLECRVLLRYGLIDLWSSPWLPLANNVTVQDLLALRLPPSLDGLSSYATIDMSIMLRGGAGGTKTMTADFAQLFALDGWAKYACLSASGGLANGDALVDQADGQLYQVVSSTKAPTFERSGPGLAVQPGQVQRIYFLWGDSTGAAAIANTMTVKATYRPRRLTV